VQVDYQVRFN